MTACSLPRSGATSHSCFFVCVFFHSLTPLSILNDIPHPLMSRDIRFYFWCLCSVSLKDKMSERIDWLLTESQTLLPWFQTLSNLVPLTSVALFLSALLTDNLPLISCPTTVVCCVSDSFHTNISFPSSELITQCGQLLIVFKRGKWALN